MISLNVVSFHLNWLPALWHTDQQIALSDPLHSDNSLQLLPELNRNKDVRGLTQLLGQLIPSEQTVQTFTYVEACAAMRDIGMVLGSLKRFGVEPAQVVPAIEQILPLLGQKTNLPPRDTLLHYTIWNPADSRCRSYTGTADEQNLIESVRVAMPCLEAAIRYLAQLQETDPADSYFVTLCDTITQQLEGMIAGIVHARRYVSTSYFADELRLYFDPIILNKISYLGPGAVEMPLFVFDHLLWNCDLSDPEYNDFKRSYLPYIRPEWQQLYGNYEGETSILVKVARQLSAGKQTLEQELRSAKALLAVGTRLKSFRMPHKKLAEEAYVQGEGGQRHHGSGGYAPSILSHIIKLMLGRFELLENAIEMNKKAAMIS